MATKDEAQNAIFAEIARQIAEIEGERMQGPTQASTIQRLALAYRYAAGGQQPGGSGDSK
jgi:hypothetical protein